MTWLQTGWHGYVVNTAADGVLCAPLNNSIFGQVDWGLKHRKGSNKPPQVVTVRPTQTAALLGFAWAFHFKTSPSIFLLLE
jgi:hypothetical protein